MNSELSAVMVDVDGTIRTKDGIPESVLAGFLHIQQEGVITTVTTGRGYKRFAEIISPYIDTIVTQNTPLMLENGSRICTKDGSENIKYYPLSAAELDYSLRQSARSEIQFVVYYPQRISDNAVIWSQDRYLRSDLHRKYGYFAEVLDCSAGDLNKRMMVDKPCMFSLHLKAPSELPDVYKHFENDKLNASMNEGSIMVNAVGRNKASGIISVSEILDVPLNEVGIAGNDHNDIPMFTLSDVRKWLVGEALTGVISVPKNHQFANPEEFGNFLQTL